MYRSGLLRLLVAAEDRRLALDAHDSNLSDAGARRAAVDWVELNASQQYYARQRFLSSAHLRLRTFKTAHHDDRDR